MSLPGPGWYSDPQDTLQFRWWNGSAWTEHQQPAQIIPDPTPVRPFAPELAEPVRKLSRSDRDKQIRKNNSMAYTGLVLALLGLLINPFAILSILGIVFSAIGLARSYEIERDLSRTHGRGTAIAGILLGIAGLVAFAYIALA